MSLDFGDAPAPYPTLLTADGARHLTGSSDLLLGLAVDGEAEGQPSSLAAGDDLTGSPDDEDGIAFNSLPLLAGQQATISIAASKPGRLDAWIDFDGDGNWTDPGEQMLLSASIAAGRTTLSFLVPTSATAGATFARFRFSSTGSLSATGESIDGEVEDYAVTIE